MTNVTFQARVRDVRPGESVLEALLRQGEDIPNSCRGGTCQCCLLRTTDGTTPPERAQYGLKDTLKARGYFLSCQCVPSRDGCGDLSAALPTGDVAGRSEVRVAEKVPLGGGVVRLMLEAAPGFSGLPGARAGQYVALRRPEDGLTRPYSLAGVGADGARMELHVKRLPDGRMSGWVHDELRVGDTAAVTGPNGDCFYTGEDPGQPLLLVGTGSGLAPLYGILRDALSAGHSGPIRLYHGSRTADGLYLREALNALTASSPDFVYTPCVSGPEAAEGGGCVAGRADATAFREHPDLAGWRVYLCGNPAMVKSAKRAAFLRGARMTHIYADPFEPAAT